MVFSSVLPNQIIKIVFFRENPVLGRLSCTVGAYTVLCVHTAVQACGGSAVASGSSVESPSIANARERAVTSAIDRNSQLANPSAPLPRGTERSRCSGAAEIQDPPPRSQFGQAAGGAPVNNSVRDCSKSIPVPCGARPSQADASLPHCKLASLR